MRIQWLHCNEFSLPSDEVESLRGLQEIVLTFPFISPIESIYPHVYRIGYLTPTHFSMLTQKKISKAASLVEEE